MARLSVSRIKNRREEREMHREYDRLAREKWERGAESRSRFQSELRRLDAEVQRTVDRDFSARNSRVGRAKQAASDYLPTLVVAGVAAYLLWHITSGWSK